MAGARRRNEAAWDKAAAFLRTRQKDDGDLAPNPRVGPGLTALAVSALVRNGYPADNPVVTQDYDGRPVAQIVTVLDPGETQEIEFELRTGPGQTGPVELDVTPGAFPGSSAALLRSAC